MRSNYINSMPTCTNLNTKYDFFVLNLLQDNLGNTVYDLPLYSSERDRYLSEEELELLSQNLQGVQGPYKANALQQQSVIFSENQPSYFTFMYDQDLLGDFEYEIMACRNTSSHGYFDCTASQTITLNVVDPCTYPYGSIDLDL